MLGLRLKLGVDTFLLFRAYSLLENLLQAKQVRDNDKLQCYSNLKFTTWYDTNIHFKDL